MRSRIALLIAPLLLIAMLPGSVSAASPAPDARAAHRAAVLAYWTPARMRAATPRDFTFDAVRGFQPVRKPAPGGGGGGAGGGVVTGASYTGGGAVLKGTGKVWFTMGGSDWICSGSVVSDGSAAHSVVLTAGHCAVGNDGVFATNWVFIPEFDTKPTYTCSRTVYGCWVADALYADAAFASAGGFNDTAVQHDWAFAVVSGGDRDGGQLDATVGSFAIQYGNVVKGDTLSAFGYPAAGKYRGSDLTYCRGPIGTDTYTGNSTWSIACDMTGGSSGGPWVATNDPTKYAGTVLSSLNSYGYSGVKNMYGPKFNSTTQAVFSAADSGTLNGNTARVVFP